LLARDDQTHLGPEFTEDFLIEVAAGEKDFQEILGEYSAGCFLGE
jgi:hypothetical protein